MAHPEELRIRVVKAVVEDGLSRNEAAAIFRVGIATAIRWAAAYTAEGRTSALPLGGDRRSVLKPHRDWLLALRRKENDLTLEAIAGRLLAAHGVGADKSMLSRFFAAEGISVKKNRARQRAGTAGRGRGARRMAKAPA
jgi:putative transposase